MEGMIARGAAISERIFPEITPELYTASVPPETMRPDRRAAHRLLALSKTAFGLRERFLGRGLDEGPRELGRLLLDHRLAVEAEMAAEYQRADFFWDQFYTKFGKLAHIRYVWKAIVEEVFGETNAAFIDDPLQLRNRFVNEVLIDTHCAFYNGRIQQAQALSLDDRAFVHFAHIEKLLGWADLSKDSEAALIKHPALIRMRLLEEAGKLDPAVTSCELLVDRFPHSIEFQDKLLTLHFTAAVAGLGNGTSEHSARKDAEALEERIARIERRRRQFSQNTLFFEVLGHLYHLRAIKLANAEELSVALLAAEKAVTYNPLLEEAKVTLEKLIEAMDSLQMQMKHLAAQVRANPEGTLDARQLNRLNQAVRGFAHLNQYRTSSAPEEVRAAYGLAQAHTLWRKIGLPPPADRHDERALLFMDAIAYVLNLDQASDSDAKSMWIELSAQYPELAEIDPLPVFAFLDGRLLESEEAPDSEAAPPESPPVLKASAEKKLPKGEWFAHWLFSSQDKSAKIRAVVAIAFLLIVGLLASKEVLSRRSRSAAYKAAIEAAENKNYLGVIRNAEAFLSATPGSQDRRRQQILGLYDEALVRWLIQQEGHVGAEAAAIVERHKTLSAGSNLRGGKQ